MRKLRRRFDQKCKKMYGRTWVAVNMHLQTNSDLHVEYENTDLSRRNLQAILVDWRTQSKKPNTPPVF